MRNVNTGPRPARPRARDRRHQVRNYGCSKNQPRYLYHIAPLLVAMLGAVLGARHGDQGAGSVAVLLPPDIRYTAQVSAGIPLGVATESSVAIEPVPAQQPETAATPEPTPEAVAFTTHEVVPGDTLSDIGARYGVDVQYLLWNNPEVGADPDMLVEGENLLIPGTPGIVYDVKLGDTITDIAATYSIEPSAIMAFEPNGLDSADMIVEGSVLVLPGAVPPPPPPPPAPEETPVPATPEPVTPEATAPPALAPRPPAPVATAPPAAPAAPPAGKEVDGFVWPVSGTLNSRFGPRWGSFHSGIDIGVASGTNVMAAASGRVVLASYSNYGYGNYVIVRHGDGSETLYAHLSRIYTSLGQQVGQGEFIGASGCTGWCTGPHLHFEVRIGGVAVDPLPYLP